MNLHDKTIAQIVKLIQMALLTGTDIVDHLRMMQLSLNQDNKVILDSDYEEIFENSIKKMLENSSNEKSQSFEMTEGEISDS